MNKDAAIRNLGLGLAQAARDIHDEYCIGEFGAEHDGHHVKCLEAMRALTGGVDDEQMLAAMLRRTKER